MRFLKKIKKIAFSRHILTSAVLKLGNQSPFGSNREAFDFNYSWISVEIQRVN